MSKTTEVTSSEGGWGWLVVASSFFITFLSFGTTSVIGIIFDELIAEFGCTKAEISAVASIAFSLQCFLGPVVSGFLRKFNARITLSIGSAMTSLGFIASVFAPNIVYIYVFFGIIGGIGLALLYLPINVVISFYFKQRRSLATALALLGGHFGAFVHPYLIRLLMSIYGWRGALLIVGAMVLNSIAFSLLFLPPPAREEQMGQDDASSNNQHNPEDQSDGGNMLEMQTISTQQTPPCNKTQPVLPMSKLVFHRQTSERPPSSLGSPSIGRTRQSSVPALDKPQAVDDGNIKASKPTSFAGSSILSIPFFDATLAPASFFNDLNGDEHSDDKCCDAEEVFRSGISTPHHHQCRCYDVNGGKSALQPSSTRKSTTSSRIFYVTTSLFRHFLNADFGAFFAANFLLCLSFNTPAVFVALWGGQLGFSKEETTLLLSLIGMGNIIGRPLLAISADKWTSHKVFIFGMFVGIAGIVTTITPLFASNFYFLAIFEFQFGFFVGGCQILLAPILADMVPLSELSDAIGVLFFVDGIAILIGPPLLALLPSYDFTFSVSGLILVASSVVLIITTYVHRLLLNSHKQDITKSTV